MPHLLERNTLFFVSLAISIWYILFAGLEYWITEYQYITNNVPTDLGIIILISLLIIASTIAFLFQQKKVVVPPIFFICSLIFSLLVLFMFKNYRSYYQDLQRSPKVLEVSKNWTIQGDRISISGRNFGNVDRQGKVEVGGHPYIIVFWSSHRIIAEQPVLPTQENTQLTVTNHRGNSVIVEPFDIKDPSEVLK